MHPNSETEILLGMQKEKLVKFLCCLLVLVSFSSYASGGENSHGAVDTDTEIDAAIDHHLKDSHYFTFFSDSEAGEHYGFALPVILWDSENGLVTFMSSAFDHGKKLAEVNGQHYKLAHAQIYKTDAEGNFLHEAHHHPKNPELIDFSITKNVLTIMVVALLLFLGFRAFAKSYQKRTLPKGFGRVLEPVVVFVRDEMAKPNIGPKYMKFTPYILTIFFFILTMNLLGMTPLGVNITGNITVTFCLAMFTFVLVQFSSNRHYWKHIFWMPGVPVVMKIALIPIELLSMLTKPFALMIRLFANMTAGHVILMSLFGIVVVTNSIAGGVALFSFSLALSLLEILVAFLQAYIFALLSALYIGMAVDEHEDHYENEPATV